jgi:hypothetical protein
MLINLAAVTRTLVNVIREHIHHLPIPANPFALADVSAQPPDKLTGAQAVGFYLYHAVEDPFFKNLPGPSEDGVPVRYVPMALQLHYLLSAASSTAGGGGTLTEQSLVGFAVKALHDNPVIDDNTKVAGIAVMDPELVGQNNRIRITMEPVPGKEAVQYWTPGSHPLRLSAYYQASVVLLEPEEPETGGGRVFSIGLEVFLQGSPRLERSRSALTFSPPGLAARTVEATPGQVPYSGEITFDGNDLASDETRLLVRDGAWSDFLEAASEWGVAASGERLRAIVQTVLGGRTVYPGLFTAAAKVITRRPQVDGTVREFHGTSNVTAFTIIPSIDSVSAPDASSIVTITGRRFVAPPDLQAERDLGLFVGPVRFELNPGGALQPGFFEALTDTPAAGIDTVRFRFPAAGLTPGAFYTIRLLVRGAENAPRWVQAV